MRNILASNAESKRLSIKSIKPDPKLIPITEYGNMTIYEVLAEHGTAKQFLDWLLAVERIEKINTSKLKNAEQDGSLITREIVRKAIIENIDGFFIRLLSDGAQALAARAHAITSSGADVKEVEKAMQSTLKSLISPVKKRMKSGMTPKRKTHKQGYIQIDRGSE